jgi:hypothetical protein
MAEEIAVTFTDEIPKIEREGGKRESKYTPILDKVVENAPKAAKLTLDTQGAASSRATSLREASLKHPAEATGKGVFVVATRSREDDQFDVYIQFAAPGTDEHGAEVERRNKTEARAAARESGERPARKARKKATKVS